jgi:hypothetical protein
MGTANSITRWKSSCLQAVYTRHMSGTAQATWSRNIVDMPMELQKKQDIGTTLVSPLTLIKTIKELVEKGKLEF